jgi:putative acetyltransferase
VATIRPAADSDGPAIADLIAAVFSEYEGCPFDIAEFPELARPASHYAERGGALYVLAPAEDPAAVKGCFAYSRVDGRGTFELHKVYLAADMRGAGWAGRLYDHAVAEAAGRGARRLRLWTDTRFASGHRFYEKRGFRRLPVVRFLADSTNAWEYAYVAELVR